ncbi:MAG: HlyD family efflux transporter periplasmic adaptor subunit [Phycisphaerales bacterium]|nr:HlyD family efflux transporter periplasmic adaptor subunit [Phycisphaerales bacterium]
MKYVIAVILVVVVGGGAAGWWWHAKQVKAAEEAKAAVANQTAKVVRRNWRLSVFANGTVASNGDVDMKAQVGGTITLLPYSDVACEVAPGALILQIDRADQQRLYDSKIAIVAADVARIESAKLTRDIAKMNLETTRIRANAALDSAKAKAQDSKSKAARTEGLYQRKLASKEDFETAQTTAALAEADVKTAQAAVAELDQQEKQIGVNELDIVQLEQQLKQDQANAALAKQNVEYCTVYAPWGNTPPDPAFEFLLSWVRSHVNTSQSNDPQAPTPWVEKMVSSLLPQESTLNDPPRWWVSGFGTALRPGSLIQSGTTGNTGGTLILTLSDISHLFVEATVDEADYALVALGQDVNITADACRGVQFKGKVVRLAGSGTLISNVVKGNVRIEVTSDNKYQLNLLHMTTNVEIIEAEKKDALTIPVLAVSLQHIDMDAEETTATTETAATETASTEAATSEGTAASKPGATTQKKARAKSADKLRLGEGPFPAQVQVVKPDGTTEIRNIQVGRNDGQDYLVISGLEEGETVMINNLGRTKWKSSTTRRPQSPVGR